MQAYSDRLLPELERAEKDMVRLQSNLLHKKKQQRNWRQLEEIIHRADQPLCVRLVPGSF